MTKLERLAYWKRIAGDTSPVAWTSEDDHLYAYFQRFRPDGRGVERVFEGIERGDEILARLLPFYQHTRDSAEQDAYFVIRKPRPTTRAELLTITTEHFGNVGQMALELNYRRELATQLESVQIRVERGKAPPHDLSAPESNFAGIYDLLCDWFRSLQPIHSDVSLLEEAFYSIACDYQLAHYIVWPLYRDATSILDPFAPNFELWIRGAEYRFANDASVTVYAPGLTD